MNRGSAGIKDYNSRMTQAEEKEMEKGMEKGALIGRIQVCEEVLN